MKTKGAREPSVATLACKTYKATKENAYRVQCVSAEPKVWARKGTAVLACRLPNPTQPQRGAYVMWLPLGAMLASARNLLGAASSLSQHHSMGQINPPSQEPVHPITGCCHPPAWTGGKSWDFLDAFRCPCPGQVSWGGKGIHTALPGDNSPLAAGRKMQTKCGGHTAGLPSRCWVSTAVRSTTSRRYSPAGRITRPSLAIKETCGCSRRPLWFFPRSSWSSPSKSCKAFGKWYE